MHVKIDDWGEPVKLGPREMESEVHKIGDAPVRLTYYRGVLSGVEVWTDDHRGYFALVDPERPWLK